MAVVTETLATKQDIHEVGAEIQKVAADTKRDIQELARELRQEMHELEYRLTVRLGTMMAVGLGAVAALVKLA